jgi:hypothetical protein
MSITNYFGKPRTKYVPYKSPYTFDHLPNDYGDKNVNIRCGDVMQKLVNIRGLTEEMTILIDHGPKRPSYFPQYDRDTYEIRYDMNTYKLENIQRMFNDVLIKCMEWVAIPFWSISKIVPTVNIFQILILKIADTDKHVEHLEKMVASLCEDNLSLNNRIKALERRFEHQSHIPLAEPIAVAEAILKL